MKKLIMNEYINRLQENAIYIETISKKWNEIWQEDDSSMFTEDFTEYLEKAVNLSDEFEEHADYKQKYNVFLTEKEKIDKLDIEDEDRIDFYNDKEQSLVIEAMEIFTKYELELNKEEYKKKCDEVIKTLDKELQKINLDNIKSVDDLEDIKFDFEIPMELEGEYVHTQKLGYEVTGEETYDYFKILEKDVVDNLYGLVHDLKLEKEMEMFLNNKSNKEITKPKLKVEGEIKKVDKQASVKGQR